MGELTERELRLPSPPHTLAKVIEAASSADATVPQLGHLVGNDPSFSIQLLRMVNSSLYNRGAKIASIERAVSILGSRSLRNLALCVAVRNCVGRRELGEFDLPRFWEESLRRAVAARLLAARPHFEGLDETEAFTCSLLQDLGLLALVRTHPDRAEQYSASIGASPDDRRVAERDVFGASHDEVAPRLAADWRLPDEIAAVLEFHHDPTGAPPPHRRRCELAHAAEALASVLSCDETRSALDRAREVLDATAGISIQHVDELLEALGEQVSNVASDLGFRVGAQPTLASILHAANTGLAEMNLSYEELVQKLERAIEEKEELARELARRNEELETLSLTDELTGLPNRRALAGRLSYEIKRAARGEGLVFVIGDLDKFKSVNDNWGHEFGDQVLVATARAMADAVRETDMVARVGGEEFGIVMVGTDVEHAMIGAKRVLEAVSACRLVTPDGQERSFTISLGLAGVMGPHGKRVDADRVATRLYKAADAALYAAKEAGRNRASTAEQPVPWEPVRKAA